MYKSKYPSLIDFLTNQEDLILLDSEIQDIENLVDKDLKAINYSQCCTELPTKETINTAARNKALKYAYANEDTYEDYVKAIEEGADYVKNYLKKHE